MRDQIVTAVKSNFKYEQFTENVTSNVFFRRLLLSEVQAFNLLYNQKETRSQKSWNDDKAKNESWVKTERPLFICPVFSFPTTQIILYSVLNS